MHRKSQLVILLTLLRLSAFAQFHYVDTVYHTQKYDAEYIANSLKFSDDKVVMWGYAVRDHYYQNIFAVNSKGDTLWDKEFINDSLNNTYTNYKTGVDKDRNIFTAGNYFDTIMHGYVAILAKADSNGNFLWLKKYYAPHYDNEFQGLWGYYPVVTNRSELSIVCALGVDTGNVDFLIIKTDSNGNELFRWQYGTPYYDNPRGGGFQTAEGGFLFGGYSDTLAIMYHEYYSIYLIKTDSAGNKLWEKYYEPLHSVDSLYVGDAKCQALLEVTDGYIIAGNRSDRSNLNYPCGNSCLLGGPRGWAKSWVGKIDKQDGHLLWEHYYGIDTADYARFEGITQTLDGGYALCGLYSYQDDTKLKLWVVRTDALGDSLWSRIFEPFGSDSTASRLNSIQTIGSEGFIVTGYVQPLSGFGFGIPYPWIVTLDSNGCIISNCLNGTEVIEATTDNVQFLIYPNPFTDNFKITYTIPEITSNSEIILVDLLGTNIFSFHPTSPFGQLVYNSSALGAGVYFFSLKQNGKIVSAQKLIKL
jgi:hypothetical protein